MLLNHIKRAISLSVNSEWIQSLKTVKGNTQQKEREYISKVKDILTNCGCKFTEASSQSPIDFRDVMHNDYEETINIEAKMTTTPKIMANDSLPSAEVYYLIFFTGNTQYKPQYFFRRGDDFLSDEKWELDYLKDIHNIKEQYCGKKDHLSGYMSCYVRPNWSFSIKQLLT
tara:strand:+ start:58 stop:570 length:513 start_codon:yes stop_codon:yes gene_type:complete